MNETDRQTDRQTDSERERERERENEPFYSIYRMIHAYKSRGTVTRVCIHTAHTRSAYYRVAPMQQVDRVSIDVLLIGG